MKWFNKLFTALCLALAVSAQANSIEMNGSFTQGGVVFVDVPIGHSLYFKGKTVQPNNTGVVVIGFSRDDKAKQALALIDSQGKKRYHHFEISQREYDIQRINGLPKNKVNPNPETQKKIWQDIKKAKQARTLNLDETFFQSGFMWPVDSGIITGVYGSQRILNGHPKRPHLGVDVAAPTGTPLRAPAAGKITLVENMELSGITVMIDHGKGLRSTMIHLDSAMVQKGQTVKKGQQVGTVGTTGRSTGPHVHWGMSWFNTRLDPALLLTDIPLKKGMKVKDQTLIIQ